MSHNHGSAISSVVNIEAHRYGGAVPLPLPFLHRAEPLVDGPLSDADAAELAKLLHALGNPHRLKIVSLLLHHPERVMNGGELQAALGLSQPTTSHHLSRLVRAGVLEREREGSFVAFRVSPRAFAGLRQVFADA
jgi:ArsR family transcriptional regulator